MSEPTYKYSGVCYTATAGQTTFALTSTDGNAIGYLSPTHIHVRTSTDSGESWDNLVASTDWTFADPATKIVLKKAAAKDEWVDIRRKTPLDKDWVDFQSGSLLTAEQLNQAETFSLYCDQELADGVISPDLSNESTDDLPEGSVNLYYTDARVESYVSGEGYIKDLDDLDTDDLAEGTKNLYYTNARVESYVSGEGYIKDLDDLDTDDLAEGTKNLYYTNARVESYVSGEGYIKNAGVTKLIAGKNIGLDPTSGIGEVTISASGGGGGGGGIPEAPENGQTYGRKDAGWISLDLDKQVQSDWGVTDSSSLAFIKNKPNWTQSDWDVTDSSSFAFIKNKPSLTQSDWDVTDSSSLAYIKNKPSGTQSDWDVTDSSSLAFIKNKPTIPAADQGLQEVCSNGSTTTTTIQAAGYRIDTLGLLP